MHDAAQPEINSHQGDSASMLHTAAFVANALQVLVSRPQGDMEDYKTVDSIANSVKGKVDILVNNAGMLDKESILDGTLPLQPA